MAHILLVEDESNVAEMMQDYLEASDHEVRYAASGRGGLDALAKGGIDLIISDNMMPGMSGVAFLREVRKQGFKTPAIMYSAVLPANAEDLKDQLNLVALLDKPVDMVELAKLIQRAVHHHQHHAS